ncbi:MAG: heme-binding protein [Candidatus Thiodiazotropha sp. (ex Ctena orbiculata)]|uniref:Heme-binding protein n=1 Tax=Candidatus Thiodiazotropha taylori TaxID=2792791 RepID=A0A944MAC6_9GAMM|nr:heme-binding protein [Candidatus Thiodiazotropha taylori]PUB88576.1 MAG: adenosylcobalamin biosynthesis, GlcG-related protein [gamma proteobacterium symbiont of Ctena orbiculata]MBT2989737.1 heme-binding protein [Candidatus Thiodiazotropha taylori]MBT2995924.1 heme-binding protein [Candidatus Thiodiazotropha taylori]MBT2999239.1 heme-binding protein [Candidatus Thiodiazotropha taylori]
MKHTLMTAILIAGISGWAVADEDAPSVNLKRLSLESANRIALGAVEACRKKGIQIGVTVVDRDGTVQAVMRDTIAAQITVPISRMKAFTAANFNAATSALSKSRADSPIGRIDGLVFSAGGLPVQAGGQLLGAVGVSGAPSGETDEECAQAGIDTIIDDLEMEM